MSTALALTGFEHQYLIEVTLQDCVSSETKRKYAQWLKHFLASGQPLTYDGVSTWLAGVCREREIRPQTYAICLAAIRKLVTAAEVRGLIEFQEVWRIRGIRTRPKRGIRTGNWLTMKEARQLIAAPDRMTLRGRRDAAVIALLLGCGLRRDEASRMTWKHYQKRDGRGCIVDIMGKGQRVRSVPVIEWAAHDLDQWKYDMKKKGLADGDDRVLHSAIKNLLGAKVAVKPLTSMGCWWVVKKHAEKLGLEFSPHDLRRTLAKQMKKAGSDWDQIQLILGHSNVQVTQMYVGNLTLEEGRAGVDLIDWEGNDELK